MASRVGRRWIERDLPGLEADGVVPPEVAERIRAHYAAAGRSSSVPLFAVLGAALVGLGVVLLLAANWEALSRPLRAALCFALLLGAQGVAGLTLVRERASTAWSEAAALGLALAAAAATALIAQTYQVQGDLRGFLGTWLLLTFALPYLFDARGVAALYLLAAGGWLLVSLDDGGSRHLFWVYVGLVAPYLYGLRERRDGWLRNAFLATVAAVVVMLGALAAFRIPRWDVLVWTASLVLAAVYALGAARPRHERRTPWLVTPVSMLAGMLIAAGLVGLGYRDAWGFVGETLGAPYTPSWIDGLGTIAVILVAGAVAAAGALGWWRRGDWPRALVVGAPLAVGAGILAVLVAGAGGDDGGQAGRYVGVAIASLWTLALGVGTTLAGTREADLRRANGGLLLLAALIFTRFSDWSLGFTLRGLVFIAFGVGFLLLNLRMRRAREASS